MKKKPIFNALANAIEWYALWWIKQKPDSEYPRRFDTDWKNYLLLWEGKAGAFDFYDWDNHTFYTNSVLGTNAYFYFDSSGQSIKVQLNGKAIGYYSSVGDLRWEMEQNWQKLEFSKTHLERNQLDERITADRDEILTAFHEIGKEWCEGNFLNILLTPEIAKHYAINQYRHIFYLALWMGQAEDIWFMNDKNATPYQLSRTEGGPLVKNDYVLRFGCLRLILRNTKPRYFLGGMTGPMSYYKLNEYSDRQLLLAGLKNILSIVKWNELRFDA